MPTITYSNAIVSLRPGALWSLANNDLSTLVWSDTIQTRPTDAEITTEYNRMVVVGPVPQQISRRQFFQQLAVQGIISQSEATAAIKSGVVPATLQTLISNLPTNQQFPATMLTMGEATFNRAHQLVTTIGTAFGMTISQIDQFFQAAALL